MGLRRLGGARLRRAASSRAGFVALVAALYLAAGVAATWPAVEHFDSRFLARGDLLRGEPAAGDHLQAGYHLWLVGHQLEHGRAPWLDPYTFRPEASPRVNFGGWPFGLPYWPLVAAFGPVVAWNLFILLSFLAAGAFAYLWLRELGPPRGAALVGGLAFALGPYRVAQSTGHFRGPISALIPLALWAFERSRKGSRWWLALSGAALASIPFSDLHLALGAIPFFLVYALLRTRDRRRLGGAVAAALAGIGAGALVAALTIPGSISSGGRSLREVSHYSAGGLDFLTRHLRHGLESFVFLGWLTPLLAVAGLVLLWRARRFGLAAALAIGTVVPILLALGTHLPLYSPIWHHFPPLRFPRVPERQMPIAVLCIAALVALALGRVRSRVVVPALAAILIVVDLHVKLYEALPADPGNRAYTALRSAPSGRLLELPVFLPDRHWGSVYMYYEMQAERERPEGYSTLAPRRADAVARRLRPLGCGSWSELESLGVRYVAVHRGLYGLGISPPKSCSTQAERSLRAHGFRLLARDGPVSIYYMPMA